MLILTQFICFSGSRSGSIHQHDVRIAEHLVARLSGHSQEVCGLSWSPDGRYLASGGNDNILNVWQNHLSDDLRPLFSLTHHQAAVKVMSVRITLVMTFNLYQCSI